jgi:TP901 family phage tail tape measure protein
MAQEGELETIRQLVIIEVDKAVAELKRLDRKQDDTTGRLSKIGKTAVRWIKVAAVAAFASLAAAITGATAKALQFGRGMAEISTLIDRTQGSIRLLSKGLLDIRKNTGADLAELQKGLYQAISSGAVDAANAIQFMNKAAKAAIGGVASVGDVVDGATTIINAFGLSVKDTDRIMDSLFTTMRAAKTTVGELSQGIGTAAPIAAALKVDFEELLAAAGALTLGGIDTGTAFTQLRGVLSKVISPSKLAAEEAKRLGIEFNAAALESKGLIGFLEEVREATGGNQESISKLFEDVRAGTAVFALAGEQADEFAGILTKVKTETGAAGEAFGKMRDQAGNAWDRIKASLEVGLINLGEKVLPTVASVFEKILILLSKLEGPGGEFNEIMRQAGIESEAVAKALASVKAKDLEKELSKISLGIGGVTVERRVVQKKATGSLREREMGTREVEEIVSEERTVITGEEILKVKDLNKAMEELSKQIKNNNTRFEELATLRSKTDDEGLIALYTKEASGLLEQNRAIAGTIDSLAELNILRKQAADTPIVTPGGGKIGDDSKIIPAAEAEALQKAKEALQDYNRQVQLAAQTSKLGRDTLKEQFQLEDRLAELREARKGLVDTTATAELEAIEKVIAKTEEELASKQALIEISKLRADISLLEIERARALEKGDLDRVNAINMEIAAMEKQISKQERVTTSMDRMLGSGPPKARQLSEAVHLAMAKIIKDFEEGTSTVEKLSEALQAVTHVIASIPGASRELQGLFGGAGQLLSAIKTGGAIGTLGVIGGGATIMSSAASIIDKFTSKFDENEKVIKALIKVMNDTAFRFEKAIDEMISAQTQGGGVTGAQRAAMEPIFEDLFDIGAGDVRRDRPGRGGGGGSRITTEIRENTRGMLEELVRLGGLPAEILDAFDASALTQVGASLLGMGVFIENNVRPAFEALIESVGAAGRSMEGIGRDLALGRELGMSNTELFDILLRMLEDLDPTDALKSELEEIVGLGLGTAQGRQQLEALVDRIIRSVISGSGEFIGEGGLSPDDILILADQLREFLPADRTGEFTKSTQVARSITEFQTVELIALAAERNLLLKEIRDGTPTIKGGDITINIDGVDGITDRVLDEMEWRIRRAMAG